MLGHGVSHRRDQGNLLALAGRDELVLEDLEERVAAHGRERWHVERSSHVDTAAPNGTLAAHLARVPFERRNANQSGDAPLVQLAKPGQLTQKYRNAGRADVGHKRPLPAPTRSRRHSSGRCL